MKCPGQDFSKKKPEDILSYQDCPDCGTEIEFFFDDKRRRCYDCGILVEKTDIKLVQDYGCADWCGKAEMCLGPDVYARFKEAKEGLQEAREGQLEVLLGLIPNDGEEAKDFFIEAFENNKDVTTFIDTETSIKPLKESNQELYERVTLYFSQLQ